MNIVDIKTQIEKFRNQHIAVVGDLILDIYHRGASERISPEAPVPVVNIDHVDYHPGGAANVAMNLRTLNADVDIIGMVGNDQNGEMLKSELEASGIRTEGIVISAQHPTTAKTRVIAGSQHVVRTDMEKTIALSTRLQDSVFEYLKSQLSGYDAIILQDYNKGVLQPSLIRRVIQAAGEADVLITVDPKFQNFFAFKQSNLIKPNLLEVSSILAKNVRTESEIEEAGTELLERMESDYIVITLGARGMAIFETGKPPEWLSTVARNVADVSGAGDTVISTLTLSLASGLSLEQSAFLGNVAAGHVCEQVGIVPIQFETLKQNIELYTQ